MLNKNQERELAYVVTVNNIEPIPGRDRVESAVIGGWTCMVPKGAFKPGDPGIYFEVDSHTPAIEPFLFLEKRHYNVKIQKFALKDENGNKAGQYWSQGLLMAAEDFGWTKEGNTIIDAAGIRHTADDSESMFLTQQLGITHMAPDGGGQKGKPDPNAKYKSMAARHPELFKKSRLVKWLYKREWGKKLLFVFFGRKKDNNDRAFPTKFPYVHKTDQERCENIPWVLDDKTPFIVTQKCDGSSGTFILERKKFGKYEFYVCSRNVRQATPDQKCWYDVNYYWQVALEYNIENKMRLWMQDHPEVEYLCWQGEVCGPGIQKNPHNLSKIHLFLFHWIDSKSGKWDIRDAVAEWQLFDLETVPIVNDNFILPDTMEEFKEQAEGYYEPVVCEGAAKQPREGFVYYKTTDPNFSFKNVSRSYLLKH